MGKKIALITGGSSGIGLAVACELSKNDYQVVISGRSKQKLESACAQFEAVDLPRPVGIVADVGNRDEVKQLFHEIQRSFGRLDLLFNNAGVSGSNVPFEDFSAVEWETVIRTNLSGVFYCMQEAFSLMKKQHPRGGRIINNGSISSMAPRPNSAAYTASKHGVLGLTKSGSLDGRAFDIACCQIDIGNADTSMGSGTANKALQADGSFRREPMIDPMDVARAIIYMDSLPLSTNVLNITVMANQMPFVGRG